MMKNGRMSFDGCSLAHVDDDRALVRLVDRSRAYRSQPGVVGDCGHYIPEEQPEVLAAKMIEFFDEVHL
jgi:pimeloyl-ACP methyl ester carboxylesterase